MKKVLQIKARELRKEGYSLQEISTLLGVSKSSASLWVENIPLSQTALLRLQENIQKGQLHLQNVIRNQRTTKEITAKEDARTMLFGKSFDNTTIKVICALLYACEGKKSPYSGVSFANSDPHLMKLFLHTLRSSFCLDERKFRVQIHVHSYHNKNVQILFWSKVTGVPMSQFIKPYEKKNSGSNKKEGYPGCANVRYHDVTISRELRAITQAMYEMY